MEGLNKIQYYPNDKQSYIKRVQSIIDAYYEDDTSGQSAWADTPADDVERLSKHLSTFPRCINEYVDKLLVSEMAVNLPQDDIDDLTVKHDMKCKKAMSDVRNAISMIETFAAMTNTPHLFTKEEIGYVSTDNILNISDDDLLELIVKVVTDMYGEETVSAEEYIRRLETEKQKLDDALLALDYY